MIPAGEALAAMAALPFGPLSWITQGRPVLIVAPHPDDESLGCGGLIAQLCQAGTPPRVVILTDGTGSHPGSAAYPPERLRTVREAEAREAVRLLGLPADRIGFAGQRDTAAPTSGPAFAAAVRLLAEQCQSEAVGTVIAPWQHDPHCDHEAAHLQAAGVCQQLALRHLSYPVWGWTLPPAQPLSGGLPHGIRLDIRNDLAVKTAAIQAHKSQYGGLIPDDPSGFVLPRDLLSVFERPWETFLEQAGEPDSSVPLR